MFSVNRLWKWTFPLWQWSLHKWCILLWWLCRLWRYQWWTSWMRHQLHGHPKERKMLQRQMYICNNVVQWQRWLWRQHWRKQLRTTYSNNKGSFQSKQQHRTTAVNRRCSTNKHTEQICVRPLPKTIPTNHWFIYRTCVNTSSTNMIAYLSTCLPIHICQHIYLFL